MGIFGKLFGGGRATESTVAIRDLAAVLADLRAGRPLDLGAELEGRDDDDAFALLLALLPESTGRTRVDIIDYLAEFDLDAAQQRDLVRAGIRDVPGPEWTAASIAMACDLAGICSAATPDDPEALSLLDAAGELLVALCETTLTTGPAGNALDVDGSAEQLRAWSEAVVRCGARPRDLLGLAMFRELCRRGEEDEELEARGFGPGGERGCAQALDAVLADGPRGRAEDAGWDESLAAMVLSPSVDEAALAMRVAMITGSPLRAAINARVLEAPRDEASWDLAAVAGFDEELVEALAPVALHTLRSRREAGAELCSPASQVGCLVCGGGSPAEDDELMVPRALRDRLLPLVAALHASPGRHLELLGECLAAPDPHLRIYALAALREWPATAVADELRARSEDLREDSMPAVRERAAELVGSWRDSPGASQEGSQGASQSASQGASQSASPTVRAAVREGRRG